ncbi:MAG: ABC transporter ATP-binding protein [Coriobacteriia bacterium]|nr:ABC transporter ATP-binding protein [Coriobacteriia bacterium]
MSKNILELKGVSYRYKGTELDEYVFKDLDFTFEPGKSYTIKGRSGSGKTTLLSLISGLEPNYGGSIKYKGEELSDINLDTYRNTHIGIVFQSYNLLPHLSAVENIILSMDINGQKIDDKRAKAIELMKKVGLQEKYADRRVLKLSGGEQQRVAIARSLAYDPDMIVADEPTGNLDRETEDEIMEIFSDLAHKQNKCVIIVSHSENISKSADKVYTLKLNK